MGTLLLVFSVSFEKELSGTVLTIFQNPFSGQRGFSEVYTILLYLFILVGTMYGLQYC